MLRAVPPALLVAVLTLASTVTAQPLPRWPSLEGGGPYVFFLADDVTVVNGTRRDYEKARALRKSAKEELFWLQEGGKEYVLRDTAMLKKLQEIFAPQMALGQLQASLVERQAKLGSQQAAIGARQAEQQAREVDLGMRMNQLAAEQARLQETGEDTEAIEAEILGLDQEQGRLEEPQAELARQQDEINRQQELLVRQREDLARQQETATVEAEKQLRALIGQAISRRIARAVSSS